MAAPTSEAKWLRVTIALSLAAISVSTTISVYLYKRKSRALNSKLRELETSLKSSLDNCASERQGRIKAQQALRKALTQSNSENLELTTYPMAPIGVVQSCFSTRNGTPRQPLLVPLARACLVFNSDLEKLWKHPSKSKFKAKVRVPRLKGGRMGVFATRSPHRPCPIGLTVAKVEAVEGNMVLLSGVDLVDGTPVLDIKPYLPYSDSIQGATVPNWLMMDNPLAVASVSFSVGFTSALADCWIVAEKKSLYSSPDELQGLIKQVLSWDIRSLSQRNRPHDSHSVSEFGELSHGTSDLKEDHDEAASEHDMAQDSLNSKEVIYHLILEGLNVSYRINYDGNVIVEKVAPSVTMNNNKNRCNYLAWRDKLR
ncbi:tRNA (Adenine(37)-N6)-methyltransferase [Quillaja saponaria]|uniref:tRNA (Adenine(37)-N6)-methyltransferase n=1 Tax=Quillaja saponaria TaxID=32244 RepID=A0AAD7LCS1_QUISA|nr:tRNA (Adenine(37)-N6)-methyltransferase [Quillaja saponaria]